MMRAHACAVSFVAWLDAKIGEGGGGMACTYVGRIVTICVSGGGLQTTHGTTPHSQPNTVESRRSVKTAAGHRTNSMRIR